MVLALTVCGIITLLLATWVTVGHLYIRVINIEADLARNLHCKR